MSRWFSRISDVAREIRMLASAHQPTPTSEIQTIPPLHLPDVQASAQYLIDMGLTPALSRRLSGVYIDIVARYRQDLESHFRRAIQGSYHLRPEHYRDIFVVQFKGTIQVLESQLMSAAWAWLCRAGLRPTPSRPQCIDVRSPAYTTFLRKLTTPGLDTCGFRNESPDHFGTWPQNNIVHCGCGEFQFYHCFYTPPDLQLPSSN
jgi:hypothetical protein